MLLERRDALDRLSELLQRASAGPGCVVLIGGEAGIGKTSLLREFAGHAQASSTELLWGACDPMFTPRPLGPLQDMAKALGGTVASALTRDTGRLEVFAAVLDALGRDSHCLVFEDLHWADEATLDLLAYLGRRIERTRTLLLCTYRDDEIGRTHPLRRLLGTLQGAARIALTSLSADAVRRLAGQQRVDAAALHEVSGGNPFFVTELLALGDAAGVPPTVRDAVLARVAPLPPAARAVLEAAAVLGPRIEPPQLESVAGADAATLDACLGAGVLREAGSTLEFRHELARQAVLESLSAPQRRALHRRALQVLRTASGVDAAYLAHHAEAAQDGDAVLEFAPLAARQAAAVGARRQAHAQYARALRFAGALPAAELAGLLEAFALECLAVGTSNAGIEARRRAIGLRKQLGDPARQAESLCRLSNLLVDVTNSSEAQEALRQAFELLTLLPPCRELAYAWRTQAHLSMLRNDNEQAVVAGQRAIELAERFGDVEAVISALNSQGTATTRLDFEAGCALLERSRDMARGAGRHAQVFNAEINLGESCADEYRFERAERHLQAAIAVAGDLQMDASIPHGILALCRLHQGRWIEAGDLALNALAECPEPRASRILAQVVLGCLRARRGDAGVGDALDEALALAISSEQLIYVASVRAARAEAAWLEGNLERCLEEARAAYDLALQHRHPWFVGELAQWRTLAGDAVEAPSFVAPPYAAQMAGRWREAAAAWRELNCPYEEARALAEGDADACRAALAIYEHLGARPAAEALRRQLGKAGVRGLVRGPRSTTRKHPFGLTTRELQVLQLLSTGLANAEIARRLHRSVRTVDHHVAAVLGKLGVATRVEAVRHAEREGLLAAQSGQGMGAI
jgi:predicted ATPase/DNA-binding CsgD family transcriptional regulator